MREDITKRIDDLNEDLKVRRESIDILKGRLKNQITSFKETITKVLDSNTSLAENIQTLFREHGIMIASILKAVGMAIRVLVEALLPGGAATASGGGEPPKDEASLKEWIRNKLKALASLPGKLGIKAAEALPGIIGGILSWILNRAKDVVGWVSQNLWALVVGIRGLIYTYMETESSYITICAVLKDGVAPSSGVPARPRASRTHRRIDAEKILVPFYAEIIYIELV